MMIWGWEVAKCCCCCAAAPSCNNLDLWVEELATHGGRCARSMFFHLFL
jgi:hypothetical protein